MVERKPTATQAAKAAPFAAGNEANVRQIRRSEFGRPQVGPQGAGQGWAGTKTAAGRFSSLTAATVCGLLLLSSCSDQSKVYQGDLIAMLAILPGHYDNTAQAEADARNGVHPGHDAVALTITHVYTPRLGHYVYYAQETAADNPLRVLSEKMYGFQIDEKRGILETVYEFVEPLRWRDGQQHKELFTGVTIEDVQPEGCQLQWKRKDDGFVARRDPKICPEAGGTSAPPAAELSAGVLNIGEYKFRKAR